MVLTLLHTRHFASQTLINKVVFSLCSGWTHGAAAAAWVVPDDAHLRPAAALVLARLPLMISSCRGPVEPCPPSCSGQRRTD